MEREATREHGRDPERVRSIESADQIGLDDQEFASVEDVGGQPSENPAVDDV